MIRIIRGNVAFKRRKKYLKLAKGYTGSNSSLSTFAAEQLIQSLNFKYIQRRLTKRTFRQLWIYRINAALKIRQNNYSNFIGSLRKLNIFLNRKILALLTVNDLGTFNKLENLSN
jgi:large subunit ribosomal protein L20